MIEQDSGGYQIMDENRKKNAKVLYYFKPESVEII